MMQSVAMDNNRSGNKLIRPSDLYKNDKSAKRNETRSKRDVIIYDVITRDFMAFDRRKRSAVRLNVFAHCAYDAGYWTVSNIHWAEPIFPDC